MHHGTQWLGRTLVLALVLGCPRGVAGADTTQISGTVLNETRNIPAVGDRIILLRLDSGMQEEAHTTTDEHGKFRVPVDKPGNDYLVRVIHDRVAYDQRATSGDVLAIKVFDSATSVTEIGGTIEIFRAGTTANGLHVSDMYEIVNESRPPVTLRGERTFEVYLPLNARIESVLAAGPGKMGVLISARAVDNEPGHFVVDFPVRPGANKFAFNYDLPYRGRAEFQTHRRYSVQQFAVMLPRGMKFESRSGAFEVLAAGNPKYQVTATKLLEAGAGPTFKVFGSGALPPLNGAEPPQQVAPRASPSLRQAEGTRSPAGKPTARPMRFWNWRQLSALIAIVGALLALTIRIVWRRRHFETPGHEKPAQLRRERRGSALLNALREELSRLDADRARGAISADEYTSTKLALEKTSQRAAENVV